MLSFQEDITLEKFFPNIDEAARIAAEEMFKEGVFSKEREGVDDQKWADRAAQEMFSGQGQQDAASQGRIDQAAREMFAGDRRLGITGPHRKLEDMEREYVKEPAIPLTPQMRERSEVFPGLELIPRKEPFVNHHLRRK